MEKKKICDIVMKLFLYGDMCKMIHYSTEKMHGHKLCDEVRDTITEFADDLAEKGFGHTGKPDFSDFSLKLSLNSSNDIAVICKNAVKLVEDLRKEIEDNDEYSGIVSIIDDFKSDMAQKVYLANFDNVSTEKLNEAVAKAIKKTIIKESVAEGTPKQNAFLKRIMGDRYKPEYDNLSVQDSSNMIDQELKNNNNNIEKKEYEVVDNISGQMEIFPCGSFFEAKKKLGEIVNDYFDNGWSCVGDVSLKQKSDICWVVALRQGNRLVQGGSIYIRKKK